MILEWLLSITVTASSVAEIRVVILTSPCSRPVTILSNIWQKEWTGVVSYLACIYLACR